MLFVSLLYQPVLFLDIKIISQVRLVLFLPRQIQDLEEIDTVSLEMMPAAQHF